MKILLLDIETAPNVVYTWGLFKQNISTKHIVASGYVLCWAAKWLDDPKVLFDSVKKSEPALMLGRIHKLLDMADVVITYNGTNFDLPTLNKEFVKHGFKPPAPYKQVDLYQVVKRVFRFESNKLDYVTKTLGQDGKVEHEGFQLWIDCMARKADAWKRMEEYNRGDVTELERLYKTLLPWIDRHPNRQAFEGHQCCPNCGSEKYQQRGWAITTTLKYRRYQCSECRAWFRGNKTVSVRGDERLTAIPL